VLHQGLKTKIHKTSGQSVQCPSLHLHLANQEQSSVAAQVAPTEIRRHFPTQMGLKFKNFLITLCHSDIGFAWHFNTFNHNGLRRQCRYFISSI